MVIKTILLPVPGHNKSKECAPNMCPMSHSRRGAAKTKNKVSHYNGRDKVFRLNGYGQKNKHKFDIGEHHPKGDQYPINSTGRPDGRSIEGIVRLLDHLRGYCAKNSRIVLAGD